MLHLHKCLAVVAALAPVALSAQGLDGVRQVYPIEADGTRHAVSGITFSPRGNDLRWNDALFEDAFLSTHRFKCPTGSR